MPMSAAWNSAAVAPLGTSLEMSPAKYKRKYLQKNDPMIEIQRVAMASNVLSRVPFYALLFVGDSVIAEGLRAAYVFMGYIRPNKRCNEYYVCESYD